MANLEEPPTWIMGFLPWFAVDLSLKSTETHQTAVILRHNSGDGYPIISLELGFGFNGLALAKSPLLFFVLVLQVEISIGTLDDLTKCWNLYRFSIYPLEIDNIYYSIFWWSPTSQSTSRSPRGFQARPRQPRPNMSRRHPAASHSYCSPWSRKNQGNPWRSKDRVQGKKNMQNMAICTICTITLIHSLKLQIGNTHVIYIYTH